MTDRNKMVRMESLRTHTLFGAGHEHPHAPGEIYEIDESFVETLELQGMAKRAAPVTPAPPPSIAETHMRAPAAAPPIDRAHEHTNDIGDTRTGKHKK